MSNIGTMVSMPLFHHFNVNDNLIIIISGLSCIASRVARALARSEEAFFASTVCGLLLYIFQAPIRAQMTRSDSAEGSVKKKCGIFHTDPGV